MHSTILHDLINKHIVELFSFWHLQQKLRTYKLIKAEFGVAVSGCAGVPNKVSSVQIMEITP